MIKELINYQTINSHGKPAFVVISYDEFLKFKPHINYNFDANYIPHEVVKAVVEKNISRVRAWRVYLGLSQKDMANNLRISQAAYSQTEAINSKLRKSTLIKIAAAMSLNYEQLR